MKVSESLINEQNVDWSLTTWEGARREQMRRWAALPLERAIMALEEMEELARVLQARWTHCSGMVEPLRHGVVHAVRSSVIVGPISCRERVVVS